jgi:drug/metabolite transporter (DMT)-like permease
VAAIPGAAEGSRPFRPARDRGVTALVVLAASYALLTVLARYLGTGLTPAQQVYLRAAAGFVIVAGTFRRRIRWRAAVALAGRREWGVIVLRAFLLYTVGTTLYSKAATLTSVAAISFLAALPLVSVLGFAVRPATATRARIAWLLGTAAGMLLLTRSGGPAGATDGAANPSGSNAGDLIALVALLAIAAGQVTRPCHGPSGARGVELNDYEITALVAGVGALSVAAYSLLRGEGVPHGMASIRMAPAVAVAGSLNALNLFLGNYAFARVDHARAGSLLTLEAVWGLLFGLAFFRQVPGIGELAGGAVIVGCAVGMNASKASEDRSDTNASKAPEH